MLGLDVIPRWDFSRVLGEAPIRSLAAEIDEYGRSDPTRTRLLAWTLAIWCATISVARPLEAAVFGVALFIVLYRLPASMRVALAFLRTPAALLVGAQLLLTAVATAIGPAGYDVGDLLPKRMFLAPLLVAFVLPRWRLLLAGLAVGGLFRGAYELLAFCLERFELMETPPQPAEGSIVSVTVPFVLALAFLSLGRMWFVISGLGLAGLLLSAQMQTTVRSASVASIAAALAFLPLRAGRGRLLGVVALVVVVAVAAWLSVTLEGAAVKGMRRGQVKLDYESINYYSSNRLELWRLTLDACGDRPWFGHGRTAWRAEIDAAKPEEGAPMLRATRLIWSERAVRYSHNTPLDLLYESGLAGLALMLGAVALALRAAWYAHRHCGVLGTALLATLIGMLVLSQFDFVLQRSILGVLTLLSACLAAAPMVCARSPGAEAARQTDRALFPPLAALEDAGSQAPPAHASAGGQAVGIGSTPH